MRRHPLCEDDHVRTWNGSTTSLWLLATKGAILRAPDAPYANGARGAGLLKYKRSYASEFEIVGATSARGTDAGCVVWQCTTKTGRIFEVVPA